MNKRMMCAASVAALACATPTGLIGRPMNDLSNGDLEKTLKEVSNQMERIGSDLKKTAENALSEAQKAGEVSAETKANADALLKAQNTADGLIKSLTEKVEGLDAKALEMAQEMAEGGGRESDGVMTLGQAVVADDAKLKAYAENGFSGAMTMKVGNAITTASGSAGGLIFADEDRTPVNMQRRRLRIRDLLNVGRTDSGSVIHSKQVLRDDQTGMVAEEAAAPVSAYGWDKATTLVKKISHVTHISEEALADAAQLQTELDGEMRYGLDLKEEKQILTGDGVGENHSGLMTEATAFVAAVGLPNVTAIDRIRLALLQLALADHIGTAIVLNPTAWAGIDLLKDGNANFIFGNPGAQTTPMLWGKDVVETNSFGATEFLVGDLFMAATLHDRMDTEVLISSEHGTNFVEGMLTMKATKRQALAIKRALAMVAGTLP